MEQVEETKLLGAILDTELKQSKQIEETSAVMGRGLAVIKRCASYLPQECISYIAQTLVFTHLDYCPVVWLNKDLEKLQLVQNRATRVTLNCSRKVNIIKMHIT